MGIENIRKFAPHLHSPALAPEASVRPGQVCVLVQVFAIFALKMQQLGMPD